jgi:hypothetical protein
MTIRLITLASLVLWAATVVAAYQDESLSFSRPTLEASALRAAPKSAVKLYEDEDFVFAHRGPGGTQSAAGFFVYGKKSDRWMEIKKVSTENAKLGRLSSGDEVRLTLGKKQYAELPLKTGRAVNVPSKIKYDADIEVYMLEFDSWQKKEEYVTRFWVDREDLEEAFKTAR